MHFHINARLREPSLGRPMSLGTYASNSEAMTHLFEEVARRTRSALRWQVVGSETHVSSVYPGASSMLLRRTEETRTKGVDETYEMTISMWSCRCSTGEDLVRARA